MGLAAMLCSINCWPVLTFRESHSCAIERRSASPETESPKDDNAISKALPDFTDFRTLTAVAKNLFETLKASCVLLSETAY